MNHQLKQMLSKAPTLPIYKSIISVAHKLEDVTYETIVCSVSGGSDSDIMLDLVVNLDIFNKVKYVWINTGLEYMATKRHLDYLEQKYNIKIERIRPPKSVVTCCNVYGQPFLSKNVSEFMSRLQKYNFAWEDLPFEKLVQQYCTEASYELSQYLTNEQSLHTLDANYVPRLKGYVMIAGRWYKGCVSALEWWCNKKNINGATEKQSMFNIDRNKYLKLFISHCPPTFKISNNCCKYAKKNAIHDYLLESAADLDICGIRKAENGVRAAAYKSCFSAVLEGPDKFRPLWWFTDEDKRAYEKTYNVTHSDCYSVYGLRRTGCCGCPYGRCLKQEKDTIRQYEPNLHKAICTAFGDAYVYTQMFEVFKEEIALYGTVEAIARLRDRSCTQLPYPMPQNKSIAPSQKQVTLWDLVP